MPPDYLSARPPDPPALFGECIEAFWFLCGTRPDGEWYQRLPLSEIESYCRVFDPPDWKATVEIVAHLDAVYCRRRNEKLKAERNTNN